MAVHLVAGKYSGFNRRRLVGVAEKSAAALRRAHDDIAIVFLTRSAMRRMNNAYRKIDKATDVLSFSSDGEGDLGDIFIAPVVARQKASARGMAYVAYLDLLVAHSVLHLGGYDHRTEKEGAAMERLEKKILNGFRF